MMRKSLVFIFLIMALMCGSASATDYYIQPNDTIQTIFDSLSPGDTVTFASATFYNGSFQLINSGTAENPIIVYGNNSYWTSINYPSYLVNCIDGGAGTSTVEYYNIQDMKIEYYQTAVENLGSNIVFENITWGHTSGNGFELTSPQYPGASSGNKLLNSTGYDSGYNLVQLVSEREPPNGNGAYASAEIGYCTLRDNADHCLIDLNMNLDSVYIHDNVLDNCSYDAIFSHYPPDVKRNITIENNIISDTSGITLNNIYDSVIDGNIFSGGNDYYIYLTSGATNVTSKNNIADNGGSAFVYAYGANVTSINDTPVEEFKLGSSGISYIQNVNKTSFIVHPYYGHTATVNDTRGRIFTYSTTKNTGGDTITPVVYDVFGSAFTSYSTGTYEISNTITNTNWGALPASSALTSAVVSGGDLTVNGSAQTTTITAFGLNDSEYYTLSADSTEVGTYAPSGGIIEHDYSGSYPVTFSLDDAGAIPSISEYYPISNPSTIAGIEQIFNITTSKECNVSTYLDTVLVQLNESVTTASYSNSNASVGEHNLTMIATDGETEVSQTWIWTVEEGWTPTTGKHYLNVPEQYTWNAGSWVVTFSGTYTEAQTEITGVEVMP